MKEASTPIDAAVTSFIGNNSISDAVEAPYFTYDITCVGADGQEKWRETFRNLVTTAGKTLILNTPATVKPLRSARHLLARLRTLRFRLASLQPTPSTVVLCVMRPLALPALCTAQARSPLARLLAPTR